MKKDLIKLTLTVAVAFILLTIGTTVFFSQNVDDGKVIMTQFVENAQNMTDDDGRLSYVGILLNNLFACAISIGIGVIPFIFLPVISILANSSLIGAMLGIGQATGAFSVVKLVIFGLLPHGIFELPAIFISMAMGIYLCRTLTMKIRGKGKDVNLLEVFNDLAKIFVLLVIPLLIVAAVVECLVTPMLISYML